MADRIPVTSEPLNAETPLSVLGEIPTPSELVYVRNHFPMPDIESDNWRLEISGLTGPPRTLELAEIRAYPYDEMEMVLECAGNGRTAMVPAPEGTAWGLGAVSQVRFGGTRLRNLLTDEDFGDQAVEVVFSGADHGQVKDGRDVYFERSLPVDELMERDGLVAWAMNGEDLAPENGFPLRLVVPGWYGMASVKWLRGIRVIDEPFPGYFQMKEYVYRGERGIADETPVRHIRPRALILSPTDESQLKQEGVVIRGVAWSGIHAIADVQVSTDGGKNWSTAALDPRRQGFGMQRWELTWRVPKPGAYMITARAIDVAGEIQPLEPRQNELGYGNNSVHSIRVVVR